MFYLCLIYSQRHTIGSTLGVSTGTILTVCGLVSRQTRCAMLLMIPSLFARRGRAFMLTTAAGLLLSGPVATIEDNIEQVIHSFTCMYENVKSIGDLYVDQFTSMWKEIKQIFKLENEVIKLYQLELEQLAMKATGEVRQRVQEARRHVQEQVNSLKDKLSVLKRVIEVPRKAASWVCEKGKSILSIGKDAGQVLKTTGDDIVDFFKDVLGLKRKRRNACGIPPVIPEIVINAPDVNLETLKNFINILKPDVDLIDFDWDTVVSELQHNSISVIREKLKTILKSLFASIQTYSSYTEKLLYLSVVFVIMDAIKYMRRYYADDSYDNTFVDDNICRLWWSGEKEDLLPLRQWELNKKYQYSTAVKLSKMEAKRILIQSITTLLFTVITTSVIMVDLGLSHILLVFREEAKFGISFKGSEEGVSFQSLIPGLKYGKVNVIDVKLEGFNLTTEPCLPNTSLTKHGQTAIIVTLVFACLLSCIFDAYASRLRAKICNLCFPDRAEQRAKYLYKCIKTGRMARRIQFSMTVGRQLDIQKRAMEFCMCWNWVFTNQFYKNVNGQPCPGCKKVMKKEDKRSILLRHQTEQPKTVICSECYNDNVIE